MNKKSQTRLIISLILILLTASSLIIFVLAAEFDPVTNTTTTRTETTDTICSPTTETKQVVRENACLDWDERDWDSINCDQYNRIPTNNCNIYNDYEADTNCGQYDITGNRTNSSALGDTPRSIMTCIKDENSEWDGFECQDVCEADSYCELTPSGNEETDYVCIDNGYFSAYESNCDALLGCSWVNSICEFDVYDYSIDEIDCNANACSWEDNVCSDDVDNTTYCAGGYGNVTRNETFQTEQCTKTLYSGLMNYDNGTEFVPINTTIVETEYLEDGLFSYKMNTSSYSARFCEDPNWGEIVEFAVGDDYVRFLPVDINYRLVNGSSSYNR